MLTECETDPRNKIVRLTSKEIDYADKIIPPAANAEIDDMAELHMEDITVLIR